MGFGSRIASVPCFTFRQDTASVNITTSYTQISASLPTEVIMAQVSNSSTGDLIIGYGASGSEITMVNIPAGNNLEIPFHVSMNTRIAVKSASGTISSGVFILNLFY